MTTFLMTIKHMRTRILRLSTGVKIVRQMQKVPNVSILWSLILGLSLATNRFFDALHELF